MPVSFAEIQGFPRGSGDLMQGKRIRRLRCAWADHAALIDELYLTQYPYDNSGALATKYSFEPWKDSKQKNSSSTTANYDDAQVTIIYETDPPLGESLVVEKYSPFSITHRGVGDAIQWEDKHKVGEGDAPVFIENGLEYSVTFYRASSVPVNTFEQAGLINSNVVTGAVLPLIFGVNTLKYEGANVLFNQLSFGNNGYTIQYKFKAVYRQDGNDVPGTPLGWNGHWRSDTAQYEKIYKQQLPFDPVTQIKLPEGVFNF